MKLIQLQEQILENTLLQHDMTSILPNIEDGKEVVYTVKRGREENELCLKLQRIGEDVYATGSYFVGIDWLKENFKEVSLDISSCVSFFLFLIIILVKFSIIIVVVFLLI